MRSPIATSVWLLTFVAINGLLVSAQLPFPGHCPKVSPMDTFDLEAYLGVWYEHSKYPFAFELGKKCIFANYQLGENSTVSVVNSAINIFTGTPSNITGYAKVLAPAQLAVTFPPQPEATTSNYQVLGTDYKTYAVVYSCAPLTNFAHLKFAWVLTRDRHASHETIEAAHKILDDNKVSKALLVDTDQKHCSNGGAAHADEIQHLTNNVLPKAINAA